MLWESAKHPSEITEKRSGSSSSTTLGLCSCMTGSHTNLSSLWGVKDVHQARASALSSKVVLHSQRPQSAGCTSSKLHYIYIYFISSRILVAKIKLANVFENSNNIILYIILYFNKILNISSKDNLVPSFRISGGFPPFSRSVIPSSRISDDFRRSTVPSFVLLGAPQKP